MDSTRERLLEAAGMEFAARGYEGATIRGIVERAGANLAAVNYHFGDKQTLYEEAVLHAHRCVKGGESRDDPSRPAPWRLRAFVADMLRELVGPGRTLDQDWPRRLVLREMAEPTKALDRLVAEGIRPNFVRLRSILADLAPNADEQRLSALAMSVVGQCVHYGMCMPIIGRLMPPEVRRRLFDGDYLADHIATLVLAALGHAPAGWAEQAEALPCAGSP